MPNKDTNVQIRRAGGRGGAARRRETVLKKRKRLEREEEYLVQDGVCLSLEEFLGGTESRRTGFSLRNSYDQMLTEELRAKALRSLQSA